MNRLQSIYFYSHLFRTFFSSFEEWEKLSCQIGNEPSLTQQEYTDLFQGTDASIYVPLWASACKGTGKVLLNETTLEVIRFYKKHGYQPVRIDGNPPDYIGEQFRFL